MFALLPDLTNPADFNTLPDGVDSLVNVYGVPWNIGAKKGFPNFNEFAMSSPFQLARKLEIERVSTTQRGMHGVMRMKHLVSLTNVLGIELWHSYTWPGNNLNTTNSFVVSLLTNIAVLPQST